MEDIERCYAAALRLLNYKWRSEKELAERLRRKGFEPDAVAPVIARLKEENWINDRRYAETFTQTMRSRDMGHRRIELELSARGIDHDSATAVPRDRDGERESLRALFRRRLRVMSRLRGSSFAIGDEGRRKLTAYLLRQGYDYSDVLAVVEEELGK